ncbi:MAG: hypothetical protein RIR00_741 [Pseudomonadota bacterium]|jgi:SAM-dependent methyltransferase
MQENTSDLLRDVAGYYARKLAEHGETPQGVDWNGEESQVLRFEQLCKVFKPAAGDISLSDIGCGYGAMLDYLVARHPLSAYLGVDVAADMVQAARARHAASAQARFIVASRPDEVRDYAVASGIFNVRLERSDAEWLTYLQDTLDVLDQSCSHGFAFNCLTRYSDEDKKRDYLYYADPCQLFDLCKRRYSRNVALLHDYGLYEFTMLVRK